MPGLDKKTYVLQAGMFWEKRYSIYKTNFDKNIILYNPGFEKKVLYTETLDFRNDSRNPIFMLYKTLILKNQDCEENLTL